MFLLVLRFHVLFVCYHNFLQSLKHNPNGRFVVVCGDGEYIIYTALAWRNRSFGSALEIVWSSDGEYAARESTSKIKLFTKNFQVCILFDKYLSRGILESHGMFLERRVMHYLSMENDATVHCSCSSGRLRENHMKSILFKF